ncbi:thioredoxin family protein [Thiomicrorhabdus sp.]|uniref:thioredoxin family protein n=1 Tax=Thiomicrorhabdus sp. TaxID=2039724 RepID=UPI0035645166
MRKWIWVIALSFLAVAAQADWRLQEVQDFSAVAKQAKAKNVPLVIYFTRERCPPCVRFEENALLPMVENGLVDGYIEIVELQADADDKVIDFDGYEVSRSEIAELYNVTTFPRLVFVNAQGRELGIRMENSGAYDYFPYYFKQRINQALEKLGNAKRIAE